jgi:hypothetical protein
VQAADAITARDIWHRLETLSLRARERTCADKLPVVRDVSVSLELPLRPWESGFRRSRHPATIRNRGPGPRKKLSISSVLSSETRLLLRSIFATPQTSGYRLVLAQHLRALRPGTMSAILTVEW